MKFRKSLFFISIVSLFLAAFLFIISPNENLAEAATTDPTSSLNSTSPPGSTSSTTPVASTNTTNNTTPTPTKPTLFSELQVTGLGASDAKVTDMNGQPISPSDNLFTWLNFHVDYKWSIADGVQIHAGDTVNFELPSGLVSSGNLSFPIYDSNGAEVGTASIQNGASSGTITFNNALENTDIDRTGTLSLVSKGTNTGDGNQGTNWMFNKGGWVSGYDETSGVPDELTWNIAFNPNEHNLTNVVITDTLGPNEEYIPGSLNAISGSYSNGGFVSNGQQLNPTVTTDGNKVIISFPGTITTAVDIYYRVKVTNTDGTTTWTNHATMGSSEGNYEIDASTSWGGSGTGNGGQGVGTMTLTKTDAETGAPLAGAEYELKASDGTVIMSNVTTDQNGKIAIKNLPYGSYTLTEVRAPDGYTLNPTPIEFTLPDNGVINLTTDQKDTAETGAVVLKKLDPDTKDTIAGTTFNLLDSEGNVVKEGLVTDGNGEIAVDNLPAGNYQFVETQPAAGYELNTTPINFTVVAGQTTPVDLEKFDVAVTVTPDTGSVTLDKVDSVTGQFLPGAVFDLLDSDDNIIESGLITDENGQIKIPNLPVGSYYFIEMHAPGGYTDNLTPIEFTITKGQDASVTAKDNKGTDTEEPEEPEGPEPPVINPGNPEPPVEPGTPEPPTTNPGTPEPPVEPGTPEPPTTNPGTPEPPVEPGTPEPPTTNPGTPEPPVEPGTPEPPTTNPGNPEPPVEPGTPEPPTTNPGTPEPPVEPSEPSEPSEPGVTEPSEPSNPEPPVNPVEPSEPSEPSEPGVTVPTEPTEPTEPSEPEIPGVVIPPVYPQEPNNDEGNNSVGSGTPETGIPEASQVPNTSNSEKGKFPQTGNETGLFAMIIGLFILLVLLFKYLIKRLNY